MSKVISKSNIDMFDEKYKYGFRTDIESEKSKKGLDENTVRFISNKKNEPEWLLNFRLKSYNRWLQMYDKQNLPNWSNLNIKHIDFQEMHYYASPKQRKKIDSLDEVDPEILKTYEKLGIPLYEQKILSGVAVDAIFDSVSIGTTFKKDLEKLGIIFCPLSEAVQKYPELVKKYLGSVVPYNDNFYSCLNSAVFSEGSFVYIPENVECPMELSTYFRINESDTGQFERTLIIADKNSKVSYLEGCTAPQFNNNQLHAAVVELIALENATIKYSTVQNWYPGDIDGNGGVYNFVTKRGVCRGKNSKISWTQLETGSAITWKYPSCILQGDNSKGEFFSVAVTKNKQQADTGTKMIHIGKNTTSTIISKGISLGNSSNTYRGLVKIAKTALDSKNYTQCDSLLIGNKANALTEPNIEVSNCQSKVEHEATTSKISEEQLLYCMQRGISEEDAISNIVNGFCKEVINELPMEFAVEARALLNISLEGAIG